MQINDVVLGLAAGVGIDLSPDDKSAYYVEWSIGELSKVDTGSGMVTTIKTGLKFPEDVEVDWKTGEIFISERTGAIIKIIGNEKKEQLVNPGGAPHQLDLKKKGNKRSLYSVCFDSGQLIRIDVDTKMIDVIKTGLGHPVGLVVDKNQKFAYVTEQDSGSLTRINISNGNATQLFTGLISPFYLAWDKSGSQIFCVQRDPANNLIKLDINSSTKTTIANGLAWRPSGVAPTSDNKLIYICADQELQVISFNGAPTIKPPKPTFAIHSIEFRYDGSNALKLKDHLAGTLVPVPEYIKNVRNRPAAYLVNTLPHIKVVLKKGSGFVPGSYSIGATGSLGGIRRKTVTPVFNPSGLSNPIDFEFMWPLSNAVGKPNVTLNWYARKVPGASIPVSISSASHKLYVILAKPTEPWVTETPWIGALDIACGWAAGASTLDDAAGLVTGGYFYSGKVSYDTISGMTFYQFNNYAGFYLSEMIERLNGGVGLGEKVNCTDSACTVSTFSNILGCDLWQARMGSSFALNPMQAIGYASWAIPFDGFFSYHEIAWKGACSINDRLFDGCLCVDADADPTNAPHVTLLPKNMLFGDCSTMNYRLRLCPSVPDGCPNCTPTAGSKQRRPIM